MTSVKVRSVQLDSSFNGGKDKCEAQISNIVEETDLLHMDTEEGAAKYNSNVQNEIIFTNENASRNGPEVVSHQKLIKRESSLENLVEDNDVKVSIDQIENHVNMNDEKQITLLEELNNTSDVNNEVPQASMTTAESVPNINTATSSKMKCQPHSSRLRRTLTSIFGCCTVTTRERVTNNSKKREGNTSQDRNVWLNCVKLRKYIVSDYTDCSHQGGKRSSFTVKDTSQLRSGTDNSRRAVSTVTNSRPSRETGDVADSSRQKFGEPLRSENGGQNLARPVLLTPVKPLDNGKKCLIIDLDETLVHSSFKTVDKADFKVGVEIEGTVHTVYVLKRPHVDVFLQRMGRLFECVLFTASLAKYADPVADFLDKWRVFRHRLFREACVFHRGNYVKDLDILGRPPALTAILDNSPASYLFHPTHALQITSWFDDPRDSALLDLLPYLEELAHHPGSVPAFLGSHPPPSRATVPVTVSMSTVTMGNLVSATATATAAAVNASGSPAINSSVITQSSPEFNYNSLKNINRENILPTSMKNPGPRKSRFTISPNITQHRSLYSLFRQNSLSENSQKSRSFHSLSHLASTDLKSIPKPLKPLIQIRNLKYNKITKAFSTSSTRPNSLIILPFKNSSNELMNQKSLLVPSTSMPILTNFLCTINIKQQNLKTELQLIDNTNEATLSNDVKVFDDTKLAPMENRNNRSVSLDLLHSLEDIPSNNVNNLEHQCQNDRNILSTKTTPHAASAHALYSDK